MDWNFNLPVALVFGSGTAEKVKEYIDRIGGTNGVLVCGKSFVRNGVADRFIASSGGTIKSVFSDIRPNPTTENVNECVKLMRSKNADFAVDLQFFQKPEQAEGDEGTGHRHGKGVGSQGGQAAVGQKQRLENQHDQSQDCHRGRPEQNRPQAGAGHVGAASADRGDLQGRDHKNESSGHGKKRQRPPVGIQRFADGEKSGQQKRDADYAPGNAEADWQGALHNVHGVGGREDAQTQCQGGRRCYKFLLSFCHDDSPFILSVRPRFGLPLDIRV